MFAHQLKDATNEEKLNLLKQEQEHVLQQLAAAAAVTAPPGGLPFAPWHHITPVQQQAGLYLY
mgnify:CR=1 FL=1